MYRRIELLFVMFLMVAFVSCRNTTQTNPNHTLKDSISNEPDTIGDNAATPNTKQNRTQPGKAVNENQTRNNKGIGPIDKVDLQNPIDEDMVAEGKDLYNNHCASCHGLTEAARGPALGNVLERRSPEFVMNMILNTDEMLEKDPVIQSLEWEYEERMTQQNVTKEEARKIVEYLRTYQ